MNEEGSSPGGGAPPPAEVPAANQGAPAAVPAASEILSAVAQQLADFKNGFFADLRKAGALKSDKPAAPAPAPVPVEAPQPVATGMTHAEFQAQMARERAITRALASANLAPEQEQFVEQTLRAVNPPDPIEWATNFLKATGLGQKPTPQAPAQAPAPAPVPPSQNFSDKGPAASSVARDPLAIIQNDPRKANMDDFRRLAAQHGQQKALQMWTDNTMAFLQTVKVRPDGRR